MMRFSAEAGRAALVAALAAALAGCSSLAKPGEQLWPYAPSPGQSAAAPAPAPSAAIEGPQGTYAYEGTMDGRNVPFIGNRGTRELTVIYQTTGGALQTVVVPAGGTVPVGYPVVSIVEVR